tara:strand:- start:1388 stop:1570 length:183 start_codon:yes stop_codon:yes gene_type:complete
MEVYSEYKMNEYGQFVDIESLTPCPQQPPRIERPKLKRNYTIVGFVYKIMWSWLESLHEL